MKGSTIKGSTVIVTGGSSGLGRATVELFHALGASVVMIDVNEEEGKQVEEILGERALFVKCDITKEEPVLDAIKKIKEKFGDIHALVNCAGVGWATKIASKDGPHDLEVFKKVIDINLVGTFNMNRSAKLCPLIPHNIFLTCLSLSFFSRQKNNSYKPKLEACGFRDDQAEANERRRREGGTNQRCICRGIRGTERTSCLQCKQRRSALHDARHCKRPQQGRHKVRLHLSWIFRNPFPAIFVLFDLFIFEKMTPMMEKASEKVKNGLVSAIPFPKRMGKPQEFAQLAAHIFVNKMINGTTIRIDGGVRLPML